MSNVSHGVSHIPPGEDSKALGRLEKVELRSIWSKEGSEFTPWLARQENLSVLSETLGLELELEARERSVGRFSADILCKEVGSDRWVLIENQIERSDHSHLGQLITYSAGLHAATIIWIAASFSEEHRAALDWLNENTADIVRFFGVEVELWKIGTSPAAPKFNVVSKPNDWSHSVAQAARALEDSELSETRTLQLSYWEALQGCLNRLRGPVQGNKRPQPQSYMSYPIGRTGFVLSAVMVRPKRQVRAELYLAGEHAKGSFAELVRDRARVDDELGYTLQWEELPAKQDCRVAVYLSADAEDRSDWPRQHEWLAARLNELHRVFGPRVAALDPTRELGAASDGRRG